MKLSTAFRSASVAGALLVVFTGPAAAVPVRLTFDVSNVQRETCVGVSQPTCVTTQAQASSFSEYLTIDTSVFSTSSSGTPNFPDTVATFPYPFLTTGNPYTNGLKALLGGQAPTSVTGSSQFENFFDVQGSSVGLATGLIDTDQSYDNGTGSTGEFKETYSTQALLGSFASYQDLTSVSLLAFLTPLVNQLTGSFFESGAASVLDATSLAFTSYAYTSYSGDAVLSAVAAVPEPAPLSLLALGVVLLGVHRRSARKGVARP